MINVVQYMRNIIEDVGYFMYSEVRGISVAAGRIF